MVKALQNLHSQFKDRQDASTKEKLFNSDANNEFRTLLKHAKMGCISDHSDTDLYILNSKGKLRCHRGTSALEGYHFHLRSSLFALQATPQLTANILSEFNLRWNARVEGDISGLHIGHVDFGLLEDTIYFAKSFGLSIYENYMRFSDWQDTKETFILSEPQSVNNSNENEAGTICFHND